MKVVKKDLRTGVVAVQVHSADDLWYLEQIVSTGDQVTGKTTRKVRIDGKEEGDAVKKTVTLSINVTDTEFQGEVLRIGGSILTGTEDIPQGAHHSISVREGSELTIQKEQWDSYQLARLEQAAQESAPLLLCIFDREQALFALIKSRGHDVLAELSGNVAKKHEGTAQGEDFYARIIATLDEYVRRFSAQHVILASPAFWKDELLKQLKDEQLRKKIVLATCSSVSSNAIEEVLRRDETRTVLRQARVAREGVLVEEVLAEIGRDGKVAYGLAEVEQHVQAGAAEQLLVSTALIRKAREQGSFGRIEALMKSVESMKGAVHIIASEHDAGSQLDGIGGIAALTRYKMG